MKMEAEKQEAIERSQCCEFKLSWVAYIRPAALFVLLCGVGFVCGSRSFVVGVVVILVALAMFCYKVWLLRSVRLYTDTRGAWIHRGVFPWDRGTTGVAWRDMDSAVYFTGFAELGLQIVFSPSCASIHKEQRNNRDACKRWRQSCRAYKRTTSSSN